MLTHPSISEAKMLANLTEPTSYQRKRLVRLFIQLHGFRCPIDKMNEESEVFNYAYTEAVKHFGQLKIEP